MHGAGDNGMYTIYEGDTMLIDFFIGLLTVVLIAVTIPLLWMVFHVSLFIAIPIAIAVGAFFGLVVVGKVIRYIYTAYKKNNTLEQ